MCGRYYVDDSLLRDIESDFAGAALGCSNVSRDVYPSDTAFVLASETGRPAALREMKWGFPARTGSLLINARAESVQVKDMYRESVARRRCIIPASGFYEWDKEKTKATFTLKGGRPLYLAGCYNLIENEKRFVILTREANASMAPVHDRMPMILDADQAADWIYEDTCVKELLQVTMPELQLYQPFRQQSLWDL